MGKLNWEIFHDARMRGCMEMSCDVTGRKKKIVKVLLFCVACAQTDMT